MTLISNVLKSDTLHDLPDDIVADVALPKERKRGAPTRNKGRAVWLGAVWEYNDEEDLQGGAQNRVPKKRKAALKRSKSTKVPSKTLSEFWENNCNATQDLADQGDGQTSQVTTPPNSSKKAMGRAASSTSQSKIKKMKPFKKPTITKPLVVQDKGYEDNPPSSKPISTHQGWTTEDVVKHNFNGIGKTTLYKLAAFRYRPSTVSSGPETSTNLVLHRGAQPKLDQEHELQLGATEAGHSSSYYGPVPSFGSLLRDPPSKYTETEIEGPFENADMQDSGMAHVRHTEMLLNRSHDDFFADALWDAGSGSQAASGNSHIAITREVDEIQLHQPILQRHPQANGSTHLDHSSSRRSLSSPNFPPKSCVPLAEPTQHIANSFEPTSSEAKVLGSRPDYVEIEQRVREAPKEFEADVPFTQHRSPIAYLFSEDAIEIEQPCCIGAFEAGEEAPVLESLPTTRTELDDPPRIPDSSDYYHMRGRVTEIQLERSDVEDVGATTRDVSNDYELDGFDEGLDDSDLLGLMCDTIVPDTQFNVGSEEIKKDRILLESSFIGSTSPSAQDVFTPDKPVDSVPENCNPERATESHLPPSPQILSSEPDNEYPMDEDDEEMFNLPDLLATRVVEKFQAPASLQFDHGDDPGSGEVYDSSLQFSPPKHRPTVNSPQKVHTDIGSTTGSPARCPDMEPFPLGEEEDWNFLCSEYAAAGEEAQVDSNPFAESHASIDAAARKERLSSTSSQARSHPPDRATTPGSATQTDLTLISWILDDSHEYKPTQPFARPDFPTLTPDRSPIIGISAQTFLRVCFRIAEMFKEGARCEALKQDAVIELFTRVTFSSREPGTTKQHFQFADLWHDRPPFLNGILANCKTTGLLESESRAFPGADEGTLARCLGRLKRDSKSATGWMLHIISIRTTDWEEIRWTKRIVSAGLVKSEKPGLSKL